MGENHISQLFRIFLTLISLLFGTASIQGGRPAAQSRAMTRPAYQANLLTLKGNLSYTAEVDDGLPTHPITMTTPLAGAYIELFDQGGKSPIDSTFSGTAGDYLFNVPLGAAGNLDPVLRIFSNDTGKSKNAGSARVVQPNNKDYFVEVLAGANLGSGVHDFDYVISKHSPGGYNTAQAFLIFDLAANEGARFLEQQAGRPVDGDPVTIRWPSGCLYSSNFNSCFTGKIYIHPQDGNRPDVILHEYGHYALSRAIDSVSTIVLACRKLNPPFLHAIWQELDPNCAWSEGWATFFQMAVQNDGDFLSASLENVDTPTRLGAVTGDPASWEGVVAASLWDIFDSSGPSEAWDAFSDGINGPAQNGIWHFSAYDPPGLGKAARTLERFWEYWAELRPGDACLGSTILQHHLVDVPPYGLSLGLGIDPPAGGSISVLPAPNCPPDNFETGTVVSLEALPAAGWTFSHWSGSLNTAANPINLAMNTSKQFVAHFDGGAPTPTPTPSPTPTPTPSPSPTPTPTATPTLAPGLHIYPVSGELIAFNQTGCTKVGHLIWGGTLPGEVRGLVFDYSFVPTDGLGGTIGSYGSPGLAGPNAIFSSTSVFSTQGTDLCYQVPGGIAWCSQGGFPAQGYWGYTYKGTGQYAELHILTEVNCSTARSGEHTLTNFRLLVEVGGP